MGMRDMYKDSKGNIIGRGEDLVYSILKEQFPQADIQRQVKYKTLMKGDFTHSVTERQELETLDLVVFRENQMPIVVRVQDPHHSGQITSMRDKVQRKTLEWNDCIVIDIQHYNCPNVFKEKDNEESRREVFEAFKDEGLDLSNK